MTAPASPPAVLMKSEVRPQTNTPNDRWMNVIATLAFFGMMAGGLWWLHSINFFYFKATFPLSEFLGFFVCAFIILVNIAMRIPMLLRWILAKLRTST